MVSVRTVQIPSRSYPIERTTLGNGLRVVVVPDRSVPVIAVAVYYDVGIRSEPQGRTGFAHLFEHMMFKGSENVGPGEHFYLIFTKGGNMNGTTSTDRTLYFEVMPKNQLDLALFLEADRMRSLNVTKENLENQRQAVKEERRLGLDNQPYGQTSEKLDDLVYDNPANEHSVIGSMQDLDAASVEDVHSFFKTYYAPNNAVLALVGDLNAAETLAKVKKYFGAIPRQPAPKPPDLTEPAIKEERRAGIEDKLARTPRLDIAYRIPDSNSADYRTLSVAAGILGMGESSRLYQRLVKEKELVTSVFSGVNGRAGPSKFQIGAMLRPGQSTQEVEAIIAEEIARLASAPVDAKELQRARISIRRGALGPRQNVLSTAVALAEGAALFNDPNRVNTDYEKRMAVTAEEIQQAAKKYLQPSNRAVVVTVPAMPPRPPSKKN